MWIDILYHYKIKNSATLFPPCMWNFVSADKANLNISGETKWHIQKCDGLGNIKKRSCASDVTLSSSPDSTLGHYILVCSNCVFTRSS